MIRRTAYSMKLICIFSLQAGSTEDESGEVLNTLREIKVEMDLTETDNVQVIAARLRVSSL
jgi:hypothetical protein